MKKIIIFLFLFILSFSLISYAENRIYKFNNIDIEYDYSKDNNKLLGFFFPFINNTNSNKIIIQDRYKGISYTNLNKSLINDPEMVQLWKEWGIMK
ncbi:hypothetical membrane protein [Brachyspira suanatina]|uniref:Hypothetical membrane protein n=1 Tax=Brachyspira suanatina TaxID=381802 RepID=A0A0G4K4M4_9SPIR|nr:hypothetical protein [Brachyspira suanatina]CRF32024.1 hypothetical membrane protein [Brachyspira suanatina]